jgi:hypothetical protein
MINSLRPRYSRALDPSPLDLLGFASILVISIMNIFKEHG